MNYKVSIAMPVYNGEKTLELTLNNIIEQFQEGLEIIISDDNSSDKTYEIALSYSKKYDFVKIFKNGKNLGMDQNFRKTASLTNGEYVWFFGQDDLIRPGTIKKIISVLSNNCVGIVYINYDQFDHDMQNLITKSFLDVYAKLNKDLILNEYYHFENPNLFFSIFNDLPSFLPATITKSEYWKNTDLTPFFGTNYIQVGLMYLNMNMGSIYVITESMIKGRIPNDKWQYDGQRHFEVITGFLKMQKISLGLGSSLPQKIYRQNQINYLLNYFFLVRLCKKLGLKSPQSQHGLLKYVFGDRILFKFYLRLILSLPKEFLNILNIFLLPIKRLILFLFKTAKFNI